MRVNDAIAGLVLVVFAAVMAALTLPFPSYPGQRYGPDLLPLIIAAGLAVCGLLLIRRGLAARRADGEGAAWLAVADWIGDGRRVASFALVLGALVLYIVATDRLGFVPVAVLIVTALALQVGARPVPALAAAVLSTAAIQWFFGAIMRVPLPRGLLEGWL